MGIKFDELKAIDHKFKEQESESPYSRLKIMDITDDEICNPPFENYGKESAKLYSELVAHFSKKEEPTESVVRKPNKIVAIVGVTGAGKTRLVDELLEKLEQHKDVLLPAKEANFILPIPGKITEFMIGGNAGSFSGKLLKRGILFIDDTHLGYYPALEKTKDQKKGLEKDFLESFTKDFSDCFIFTTWNIFGLTYALSKNPNLLNKFDKIIWIDGLSENDLVAMIKSRIKEYAINKDQFQIEGVFDSSGLEFAIKSANKNPRLLISLVNYAIHRAHEKKSPTASKEIFEEIVTEKRMKSTPDEVMGDKTLFAALAVPRVNVKLLEAFTGLDRTTIQKKVQQAVDDKMLEEMPKGGKENYYSLNCFLRSETERRLFEELKERANRFVNFNEKLL